ncbi:MAG TPA: phospholipase D-like domain-containing protein [Sporichthyaceae bacterium]|nr:phospholipase D-like domain-containing protein [Sporichthyaceae bacterium]
MNSARRSVWFTSEDLADPAVTGALTAAAQRGVDCEIVMTDNPKWHPAYATLSAAGRQVATYPNKANSLYVHEKLVLDDAGTPDATMLLGSQNATATSLTRNRELSVWLTAAQAPDILTAAAATFTADRTGATRWNNTR